MLEKCDFHANVYHLMIFLATAVASCSNNTDYCNVIATQPDLQKCENHN